MALFKRPTYWDKIIYVLIFIFIAIYCYLKKVERNPSYGAIFYKLAQECQDRCSADKQKYYYQKTVYHDPTFSDAYYKLAVMFEQEGDYATALPLYKTVTELDAWNYVAHLKVGIDYFKNGESEYALRHFKQAIRSNAYLYYEPHYYLGRIYAMKGDYETAVWYYRRNEGVNNEHIFANYLGLGVANHELGREPIAQKCAAKLRDLQRSDLAEQLEQFMKTGQYPEYLGKN